MKLLENAGFESLTNTLSLQATDIRIDGRIESYSCKMAGNDKKLYKMLNQEGQNPNDLQVLSPPQTGQPCSISPTHGMNYGSYEKEMADACSRKTLFHLKSTLNASFQPDYDFSNAKSEEFSREPSLQEVKNFIDSSLSGVLGEAYSQFKLHLWAAIEEEIQLSECTVYSYNPDLSSDPYGEEGCLWSFNYFFYNKKMKRIVFFTCRGMCLSALDPMNESDDELEFEMDPLDLSENTERLTPMMVV
ncbi:repressor of RNA polymerase III transcription MAF1 homolog [Dendronephthya gigantea]|uniref:repressor of RNA polymerase III transcription MAF1 homolog n=1 Tax=Dendronephthya gigantea TaxID=151771 RepID=UPI00106B7765|nr:repressor of RNA polymerase III transcription MAF1 homolog [Dendronephthya gigantea]